MTLHKELYKSVVLMQKKMKLYYNKKKSEGPDFKKKRQSVAIIQKL